MQTFILSHYPPVIRRIKEIERIANAEDQEFAKLNAAAGQALRNMFVFTADETGVWNFEKLFGIKPKAGQSLDERKAYVFFMMNQRKMSLSELEAMLSVYSEGIALSEDVSNMELVAEINIDAGGGLEMINRILEEILPLNVCCLFFYKARIGNGQERAECRHVCRCMTSGEQRQRPEIVYRTGAEEKNAQQGNATIRHNLWRFDGTCRFDGSRTASAYIREEKL